MCVDILIVSILVRIINIATVAGCRMINPVLLLVVRRRRRLRRCSRSSSRSSSCCS